VLTQAGGQFGEAPLSVEAQDSGDREEDDQPTLHEYAPDPGGYPSSCIF
jgi:hypothetical protein